MIKTIDMQDMRYLNLFERITKVRTQFCFKYNETLIFCVPKRLVMKVVGNNGRNLKKINQVIGKRIKVIPLPKGIEDAEKFIKNIVNPVTFRELKVNENEIVLTAGIQSKAALIGKNKRRLNEMQKIIKDFFGKEFRIA